MKPKTKKTLLKVWQYFFQSFLLIANILAGAYIIHQKWVLHHITPWYFMVILALNIIFIIISVYNIKTLGKSQ